MIKIKKIIVLICVIWGTSAYSYTPQQTGANSKDSIMITTERFDFEEWKIRKENGTTFYQTENGTKVRIRGTNNPSIVEILPPPSFITKQKNYHRDGTLANIIYFMDSSLKVGIWRTYDIQGNLISEVDEDKKFGKIKPEDILHFLEKEGYINVKTGEGRFDKSGRNIFTLAFVPAKESVIVGAKKSDPLWYITIQPYFENRYTKINYIINGNTGEVIERKTEKILPIE